MQNARLSISISLCMFFLVCFFRHDRKDKTKNKILSRVPGRTTPAFILTIIQTMQQSLHHTYSPAETEALKERAEVSVPESASPGTDMEQNFEANPTSFVVYSWRGRLLGPK